MPWGGEGRGGGEEACRIPGRGEEDKIEAGRYKVGWMRLSAGGRKRGEAAALVAGTRTGSQGWGAWRATTTAGDQMTARQMPPPVTFWRGGLSSHPSLFVTDPWTAMAHGSNGGDKK